jgi:hypothetical protein
MEKIILEHVCDYEIYNKEREKQFLKRELIAKLTDIIENEDHDYLDPLTYSTASQHDSVISRLEYHYLHISKNDEYKLKEIITHLRYTITLKHIAEELERMFKL